MDIQSLTEAVDQVSRKYTKKYNIAPDNDWFVLKLQEELGELIQSYLMMSGKARKKGKSEQKLKEDFAKEFADVFCHVLLLAKHNNIDIEKEIKNKWLVWNKKTKITKMKAAPSLSHV
jgi:NTP pyrophosphatase (non-canonical NTP hydrolase)